MTSKSSSGSENGEMFSTTSKRTLFLNGDELELWELYYYAGITVDPKVFKAMLNLIKLNIHPKSIYEMLKDVSQQSKDFVKTEKPLSDRSASVSIPDRPTTGANKRTSRKSAMASLSGQRNSQQKKTDLKKNVVSKKS